METLLSDGALLSEAKVLCKPELNEGRAPAQGHRAAMADLRVQWAGVPGGGGSVTPCGSGHAVEGVRWQRLQGVARGPQGRLPLPPNTNPQSPAGAGRGDPGAGAGPQSAASSPAQPSACPGQRHSGPAGPDHPGFSPALPAL